VRHPWTRPEIELLCAMYPHCHTADVAAWLGHSLTACYQAAINRRIRKDPEYLASDAACRVRRGKQHTSMIASRFKRGQAAWNKGTKGIVGVQDACRATQFKKGQAPSNTRPVGSYRVTTTHRTPVLEKKTSERRGANHMRWTPVARLVWEAAHGEIPKGCIVVFKPGTATVKLEEITVDRLECITRAEHANRNHPRNRSPELGRLVQLKGAITRQVNRITREAQERT
jgi:hypothetical protein